MAFLLKGRKNRGNALKPLNITPLIDINANLLFFLMINASIQEDRLEAGKDVELPDSNARTAESGDLISLVIGLDHVSVNELEVMKLESDGSFKTGDYDDAKRRVKPLYTELTTRFQELVDQGVQTSGDDDELPVVLVQADRRLPYRTVSKLMRTCGQAGFTKFRFAAQEAVPEKGFRGETGG